MAGQISQQELAEIRSSWKQFLERQQMAAEASDETDDVPDDEPTDDEPQTQEPTGTPSPGAPGEGEVTVEINESAAQAYQEQEEEVQEQLDAGDEQVAVGSVEEGVRVHYSAEDHEEVLAAKAALIGEEPGSMYDFWEKGDPPESMVSERPGYDRIWIMDISTDEPFGPFSPTKYTIREMVEELGNRVENNVLVESDVYELA